MSQANTSLNPKGYVHKVLMSDEIVLHQARLHKCIFVWPIIFAVALFSHAIIMAVLLVGSACVLIPLFELIIGVMPLIGALINVYTSEFAVTNKRVIFKTGFIHRTSLDVFLKNVGGVSVDQDILGRVFDYGAIGVEGVAAKQQKKLFSNNSMLTITRRK